MLTLPLILDDRKGDTIAHTKANMRGWFMMKMDETLTGIAPDIALAMKPGNGIKFSNWAAREEEEGGGGGGGGARGIY
jgi:hypothetical protein